MAIVVFCTSLLALLVIHVYPSITIVHPETREKTEVWPSNFVSLDALGIPTTVVPLSSAEPVQLRIPKLSIDTTFEEPLGLNTDGTIEVPHTYEKVGWYERGVTPGEVGTAVILGHVDSYKGAAVFYSLGQLIRGDRAYVLRTDGSEAVFEIEYLERYPQSKFPTEKIYGNTSYPSIRLITCSGIYKKGEQRYTHTLVVYGRLVESSVQNEIH